MIGQAVVDTGRDGTVRGYVGTITDITTHKQSEETVRRHTEILEATVQARTAELQAAKEAAEAANQAKKGDVAGVQSYG